ncbi:LysR family transcriptional regulator [Cytobacillus kochii]|uniref:LysR family transcriptional regulator n=1 Tax=Cytobacillus kochii TaxID=859143 RepID=UPI002E1E0A41|nr:LysR family transcriptional regulator [Cytobacillus kochii]
MDLTKLRYFYTTAKLENVSHAAKVLLISQPALSKAIANLEAELELDLFHRKGKHIALNENGVYLYRRAERIFAEIDNLNRDLLQRKNEGSGTLSIVSTLPYTVTDIFDSFLEKYPKIKFTQVPLSKNNLQHFVEFGKYDVCITTEEVQHPNVEWSPLFNEQVYLSVPLAFDESRLDTIDLTKIESLPFIGLTNNYSFRQFTDNFCQSINFKPSYQFEVEESTAILQFVKNGRGVSFSPQSAIHLFPNEIKHLEITNGKFERTIGLLNHKNSYPTKITECFLQHCLEFYQDPQFT